MISELLEKERALLIEKAYSLKITDKVNEWHYDVLIRKLLELNSENLELQVRAIRYFIIDSYNGERSLSNQVGEFLSMCSSKKINTRTQDNDMSIYNTFT